MRLSDDIQSTKLIWIRGWLFLFLGLFAGAILLAENWSWQNAMLTAICVWAWCRWYYFMF